MSKLENEKTDVLSSDEQVNQDVDETNAAFDEDESDAEDTTKNTKKTKKAKGDKGSKLVKAKRVGLYAAITVGVVAVGLIAYAGITLAKQESSVKKQIAMEEKAEKEAVAIPDNLRDEARAIVKASDKDSSLGDVDVQMNTSIDLKFDDGLCSGSIIRVSDDGAYASAIGDGKVYVLSEYKITNKLFSDTCVPNVLFFNADSKDDTSVTADVMCRVISDGDANLESSVEWKQDLSMFDTFKVGDVVQVLSYVDVSDLADNFKFDWYTPSGDSTYTVNIVAGDTADTTDEAE